MASIIILTGIPGVGKTTILNELRNLAKERGIKLTVLNYGTVMNELFKKYGRKISRDEIRRQQISVQKKIQEEKNPPAWSCGLSQVKNSFIRQVGVVNQQVLTNPDVCPES